MVRRSPNLPFPESAALYLPFPESAALFPKGWTGTWRLHEPVRKLCVLF